MEIFCCHLGLGENRFSIDLENGQFSEGYIMDCMFGHKEKFDNVYFINGTAYAGKSTMIKMLAEKYNGILCEENYHDTKLSELDKEEFPALTYTRDLKDWRDFIRRTPDEYENWIKAVTKECVSLELQILENMF